MDGMRFFDLQVDIHIVESLVAGLVVGPLVVWTSRHNGWDFAFIARTDDADLDQVWQAILVGINPAFDINDLADGILTGKGGEALAIKIVILVGFRDQTITDQLIDQAIASFGAGIKELVEIFKKRAIRDGESCFLAKGLAIIKIDKKAKAQ